MKFVKIENKFDAFFPVKEEDRKQGDEVIGVYQGTKTIKNKKGEENTVYEIITEDDKRIGVNSYPVIDTAFKDIAVGTVVKVVFEGKKLSEKSGRKYNDFSVFVASEE